MNFLFVSVYVSFYNYLLILLIWVIYVFSTVSFVLILVIGASNYAAIGTFSVVKCVVIFPVDLSRWRSVDSSVAWCCWKARAVHHCHEESGRRRLEKCSGNNSICCENSIPTIEISSQAQQSRQREKNLLWESTVKSCKMSCD